MVEHGVVLALGDAGHVCDERLTHGQRGHVPKQVRRALIVAVVAAAAHGPAAALVVDGLLKAREWGLVVPGLFGRGARGTWVRKD